jgi:glucose-6-phosphate 1-dehydrogenase
MIPNLALFGASGDLAGRFLLPALATGRFGGELAIVGVVEPVLATWHEGQVPLEEYPADSDGPPPIMG